MDYIKKEYIRYQNLYNIVARLDKLNINIERNEETTEKLKEKYKITLMKAGKLLLDNKVCPTCFKPLNEKEVQEVTTKRYSL